MQQKPTDKKGRPNKFLLPKTYFNVAVWSIFSAAITASCSVLTILFLDNYELTDSLAIIYQIFRMLVCIPFSGLIVIAYLVVAIIFGIIWLIQLIANRTGAGHIGQQTYDTLGPKQELTDRRKTT